MISTPALEESERRALCDLFGELGPDAPTLCEGWTTSDLAVHLIMCEARPHAWAGVPLGDRVPALRRYFDRMAEPGRSGQARSEVRTDGKSVGPRAHDAPGDPDPSRGRAAGQRDGAP